MDRCDDELIACRIGVDRRKQRQGCAVAWSSDNDEHVKLQREDLVHLEETR